MTNASELLPCPFCGNEMEFFGQRFTHAEPVGTECFLRHTIYPNDVLPWWNTRQAAFTPTTDRDELVERAGYCINNPSAWDDFDQGKSDLIAELIARIQADAATIAAMGEAMTPSAETKAAYIGEFKFKTCVGFDDDSHEIMADVAVPWTTIKEIMAAILKRAALKGGDHG